MSEASQGGMGEAGVPRWAALPGTCRLIFEVGGAGGRQVELVVPEADVRVTAAVLARGGAGNMTAMDDRGDMRAPHDFPDRGEGHA